MRGSNLRPFSDCSVTARASDGDKSPAQSGDKSPHSKDWRLPSMGDKT
jgi:hypothetical protein